MTPVPSPANIGEVASALEAMHGWREWHWWPDADPFEVCVGAILVQNTMWANVERALDRLRTANVLAPETMSALTIEQLEELVRPSGQFRQKQLKLRAFLALLEQHGSIEALLAIPAPELRTRLLATFGIGPETADCIILYAAHQPVFIVDAYLIRLFTRLGMGPIGSTSYDVWQRWVLGELASDPRLSEQPAQRDTWARFRAEIVMHCKFLCRKRAPACGDCLLLARCPGSPMNQALNATK
jgi:endonuclease-3 related protein